MLIRYLPYRIGRLQAKVNALRELQFANGDDLILQKNPGDGEG
jgi:hypothetical protein